MQDAQYPHFALGFKDFIDCNEWEGRKSDFPCASDAAGSAQVWEAFQSADTFDDGLRNPPCGLGTALSGIVAEPLEVIRGVRRPADAHQPG